MTAGNATLNGDQVPASGLNVTVSNGDKLLITASKYASVSITNLGQSQVNSSCSIGLKQKKEFKRAYKFVSKILGKLTDDLSSYDFMPNTPVVIANPLWFGISGKCTVKTNDTSDVIVGSILKGSGTLNGQTITSATTLTVKKGDTFTITASASAEVSITNKGKSNVHADCSLDLETLRNFYQVKTLIEKFRQYIY
jgi:hypothetical protein